MTEAFDISTIEVSDTFDVEITHPKTGEPMIVGGKATKDPETGLETVTGGKPMTVTVYGPSAPQYKAAQAAQSRKNIDRIRKRGAKAVKTPEEEAADAAALLSAITVSLNNFTYKGGPQERETFRAMYLDPKMGWLTDQVNGQAADWGNFTKG